MQNAFIVLNRLHGIINFTFEMESGSALSLLDVNLIKPNDGTL